MTPCSELYSNHKVTGGVIRSLVDQKWKGRKQLSLLLLNKLLLIFELVWLFQLVTAVKTILPLGFSKYVTNLYFWDLKNCDYSYILGKKLIFNNEPILHSKSYTSICR